MPETMTDPTTDPATETDAIPMDWIPADNDPLEPTLPPWLFQD